MDVRFRRNSFPNPAQSSAQEDGTVFFDNTTRKIFVGGVAYDGKMDEDYLSLDATQALTDIQKQTVLTKLGIADEMVFVDLLCGNSSESESDIIGAEVSLTYGGNTTTRTWSGTTLVFVVPMFEDYTISFGTVAGYYTPDSISKRSRKNMVRRVTAQYDNAEYNDLSMLDHTGTPMAQRETANCYVISGRGYYELPIVYGCGITGGTENTESYTQVTGTNTKPFYNYLNNQITSAFIEDDTGVSPVSADVVLADSASFGIDGVYVVDRGLCKFMRFHVSSVPALGGNATIAVKDSGGQIMWSWHIWAYPFTLSTFQHTSSSNRTYDIMDVNLGWVKSAADSVKGTSPYYQWGRKDPMLRNGGTAAMGSFSVSTTAPSVAATIQNPTTFNMGESTNNNWWNNNGAAVNFYNYWDASQTSTGRGYRAIVKTVYDPCPTGFHIPCGETFTGFSTSNGGTFDNGYTWDGNFFQAAGYRARASGSVANAGSYGYYWSAASNSATSAYSLNFNSGSVTPQYNFHRANGFSVRPVRRPQN